MGPTAMDIVLGLLPMILLIAAWGFFVWRMRRPGSYQVQCLEMMRRQTEALERISAALDKRG